MTDEAAQRVIRGLPVSARMALVQIAERPSGVLEMPTKTLLTLLSKGVVNVVDGRGELSDLGRRVITHLDVEGRRVVGDRLLHAMKTIIEADASQDAIEQVFQADPAVLQLTPIIGRIHAAMRAVVEQSSVDAGR